MYVHHRNVIRDDHNGFYKLVSAIDYVICGSPEQPSESSAAAPVAQLACRETVYTANITSDAAVLLSDIMKTVFSITLNWCDKDNLNEVKFNLCCKSNHGYLLTYVVGRTACV